MQEKRYFAGVWPVVQRELRESARRPANHRMRFWSGVFGAVLLCVVMTVNSDKRAAEIGGRLLVSMHILLVGLIFLVVPLLTADCIAREKRDGTLGLLFLTPLSAGGIVAGKVVALVVRAFTLWLAMLPILLVPFMEGGINWQDASTAIVIEFCAAVLCGAAGLLASSLTDKRNPAVTLAWLFSALFLVIFSTLFTSYFLMISGFMKRPGVSIPDGATLILISIALMGGEVDGAGWYDIATRIGTIQKWEILCAASPLLVLFIAWLIGRFAARRVERSWQDKAPTARRLRLIQRYCTPLFRRRFRAGMQRALDKNPIAWLQQYSWKDRVTKWGLCLAVLMVLLVTNQIKLAGRSQDNIATVLFCTLAGAYLFVGVGSFLEEKRSGALELLLVTPIKVNKIIQGRAWGMWRQFAPAFLILPFAFPNGLDNLGNHIEWVCGFFALPVFATYAALRLRSSIAAAGLAVVGLMVPLAFANLFAGAFLTESWGYLDAVRATDLYQAIVVAAYALFVWLTFFLLRHSLSRRIYSF